tara:strand:+ start:13293 stop:13805 length:513 start_codon:yes stop_codon:yes gene_type:complete
MSGRGYMPQPERLDWGTPEHVFQYAQRVFGIHTIDLAASHANTKCSDYITEEMNALEMNWGFDMNLPPNAKGWLNPPYGRMLKPFAKKVSEQLLAGEIRAVTVLVPARTDTEWFSIFVKHAVKVVFIKGRLKFDGVKGSAPFPSVLMHLVAEPKKPTPATFYSVRIPKEN